VGVSDHDVLLEAIFAKDVEKFRDLVASGVNLNAINDVGQPLIHSVEAATAGEQGDPTERIHLLAMLADLGADLNALANDDSSILIGAIIDQDLETLGWLLDHGVDPNRGCGEPWETVYDFANFVYGYENGIGFNHRLAERPEHDLLDDGARLEYLDREAQALGCRRPDYLFLLKEREALSGMEIARRLGGDPSSRIRWENGGWRLTDISCFDSPVVL
jgi:hypothetical protein